MLGKITIAKEEIMEGIDCNFNIDAIYDYEYIICNKEKKELNKILTKSKATNAIKQLLEIAKSYPERLEEEIKLASYLLDNEIDIIESAEYIEMEYDLEEIKESIEKNPKLKNKKIVLPEVYNLNYKSILEIEKVFKDEPYIYIKTFGNIMPINIETFKKTLRKIDEIVSNIKKLDLSPIEQVMFAYDVVKDKEYQSESKDENVYLSRDVSSSLFGDKIVCSGYSNIFKTILDKLGIKNEVYFITNHQRNIAYIKDEKYNINGVYYFDTTWDSKIESRGNEHFNKYLYFGKTKSQMDEYFPTVDETLPSFTDLLVSDEYDNFMEKEGITGISKDMIKTINQISRLIDGNSLIGYLHMPQFNPNPENRSVIDLKTNKVVPSSTVEINKKEIDKKLEEYLDLFNKPIDAITMLKILFNVRKQQWYLNPEKYPFNEEDLIKTTLYSRWEFKKELNEMDILQIIFKGKRKIPKQEIIRDTKDFIEDENIDRNIERVKTAKVLRRVLESKKQN